MTRKVGPWILWVVELEYRTAHYSFSVIVFLTSFWFIYDRALRRTIKIPRDRKARKLQAFDSLSPSSYETGKKRRCFVLRGGRVLVVVGPLPPSVCCIQHSFIASRKLNNVTHQVPTRWQYGLQNEGIVDMPAVGVLICICLEMGNILSQGEAKEASRPDEEGQ